MNALSSIVGSMESQWDPEICMIRETYSSPGYHSFLPKGSTVHATRATAAYAALLLAEGSAASVERACRILEHLLTLQETDPYKGTFGIWSWYYEEPLEKMSPPDWNWADFIGANLAYILKEHASKLPPALRKDTESALYRAALSIFRRNVAPTYTNIALMGAAVTAAAAELCKVPFFTEYARRRIAAFLDLLKKTGGFTEYNSPTYTFVAMTECERILQLVEDPQVRSCAEQIRVRIWEALAEFFHPATGQMAPPWSRAYSDTLPATALDYLRRMTGVRIPGPEHGKAHWSSVPALPCPEHLRQRFASLPAPEHQVHMKFMDAPDPADVTAGTAWMDDTSCIGSVSHDSLWVQRRPLSAFWKLSGQETPAVFNTDAWHDGKEFASFGLESVQEGPKVLSHMVAYTNRGEYHLHLDPPEGRCFHAKEFALSWELTAPGAEIEPVGESGAILRAGSRQIFVEAASATFAGNPVRCEIVREENRVLFRAVLYRGKEKAFVFDENLACSIPFAVELQKTGTKPELSGFEISRNGTEITIRRNGQTLTGHAFGTPCV